MHETGFEGEFGNVLHLFIFVWKYIFHINYNLSTLFVPLEDYFNYYVVDLIFS